MAPYRQSDRFLDLSRVSYLIHAPVPEHFANVLSRERAAADGDGGGGGGGR